MTSLNFTSAAREEQWQHLLKFAQHSKVETGFGYLLDNATVSQEKPVELWITCRMVHVYSLAWLKEHNETWKNLAQHGINCLNTHFKDHQHGGWYSAISQTRNAAGQVNIIDDTKAAYAHAFVILAASSAKIAKINGAAQLLNDALENQNQHWWEETHQKVKESYNRDYSETEPYRGINANMHTVESYLAAYDATDDETWLTRALTILEWVLNQQARANNWRIAEHYDTNWREIPDYNIDRPTDPFRPYGHTPGHGLEWGRLALHVGAQLNNRGKEIPEWILETATQTINRAISDGWETDGAPGFVYTTDHSGKPIAQERMHWVICEAIGAVTTLIKALRGDCGYQPPADARRQITALAEKLDTWWQYCERYIIVAPGQWRHELGADNQPSAVTWKGKPDAYHIAQMLLLPDLKLAPTFAAGLME